MKRLTYWMMPFSAMLVAGALGCSAETQSPAESRQDGVEYGREPKGDKKDSIEFDGKDQAPGPDGVEYSRDQAPPGGGEPDGKDQ